MVYGRCNELVHGGYNGLGAPSCMEHCNGPPQTNAMLSDGKKSSVRPMENRESG